jgi:hypothetical protein
MPQYIAPGTAEEAGAPFTLADGSSSTVNLKPANNGITALPADVVADVQIQTSDVGYVNIGRLTPQDAARNVAGPGTFRVVRRASVGICGVDRT